MQVLRTESLLESLGELKAIEDQRLADETASAIRMRELARREREREETALQAAETARIAAARAAEVERAREQAEAEREARMRVEAADAAEHARLAAALDAQRFAFERELRRQAARRVRPPWMIAVTAIALVIGAVAGGFAVMQQAGIAASEQATRAARRDAAAVVARGETFAAQLDRLANDVAALGTRLDRAMDRVVVAERDAADEAVRAAESRRRKAEWDRRQADAKRAHDAWEAARKAGLEVSKDCLDQAVCKATLGPKHPSEK